MTTRHVIVDGSNLATEGRNMPSLEQLDRAVREFIAENPRDEVTVVVDASFGHRIDPSEVAAFEAAEEAGEVISPPAGAIGRGDAFLLRIAEKIGATVLSNDSFQEFHAEHSWLFEKGRLVGGKPVPGVGWIFMDRTPVRGAKSREVIKEAKRKKRVGEDGEAKATADKPARTRPKVVDRAIARATEEVVEPQNGSKGRRRRAASPPSEPVNQPLAFITFIAAHPLGSEVVGTVAEYSSHGAFVDADGARCYIPLSAMGDPPPRRAREVVTKGEDTVFVVQAFDPLRRGVELALPGFAHPAGSPTAETVEAEIHQAEETGRGTARRGPRKKAPGEAAAEPFAAALTEAEPAPAGEAVAAATARRAPARKRASAGAEPAEVLDGGAPATAETAAPTRARRAPRAAAGTPPAAAVEGTAAAGAESEAKPAKKRAPRRVAAPAVTGEGETVEEARTEKAPVEKAPRKRAVARKAPAGGAAVAGADEVPPGPGESVTGGEGAPSARKTAGRKRVADKVSAPEAVSGKTTAAKAVAGKAAAARKAAGTGGTVEKVPAVKKAAAAKKAPAAKAAAGKAPAAGKAASGRKASPAGAVPEVDGESGTAARRAPARRATESAPTPSHGRAGTAEDQPGPAPVRKRTAKTAAEPAEPPAAPAKRVATRARKSSPPGS